MVEERKGQFGNAEKTAEETVETVRAQVKWTETNSGPVEAWLSDTMSKPWPPHRSVLKNFELTLVKVF